MRVIFSFYTHAPHLWTRRWTWNVSSYPFSPQEGTLHLGCAAARRCQGFGPALREVRGGVQAHQEPGNAHRQAAADFPGSGEREAEDRQVNDKWQHRLLNGAQFSQARNWNYFSMFLFLLLHSFILLGSVLNVLHRLLYSVLPKSVANELRHQRPVPPKR